MALVPLGQTQKTFHADTCSMGMSLASRFLVLQITHQEVNGRIPEKLTHGELRAAHAANSPKGGRLRTIFMVSRLTVITRWNSSSG